MKIITDLNYCRRCKKEHIGSKKRTNYCSECDVKMRNHNSNRWNNSEEFMNTSFADCVDLNNPWNGFRSIKYTNRLIKKITEQFPVVRYLKSSTNIRDFSGLDNICGLYLISDSNKVLHKVGQTVSPYSRFSNYHSISKFLPIKHDLFVVENYKLQDLYEDKIRNFMEYLGFVLPSDNTGQRLKYIEGAL